MGIVERVQIQMPGSPPYGFYHIVEVREGGVTVAAHVSVDYPDVAKMVAGAIAEKCGCEVEDC